MLLLLPLPLLLLDALTLPALAPAAAALGEPAVPALAGGGAAGAAALAAGGSPCVNTCTRSQQALLCPARGWRCRHMRCCGGHAT